MCVGYPYQPFSRESKPDIIRLIMKSSRSGVGEAGGSGNSGAPTKYSTHVVQLLCEAVELGCTGKEAAAVAGIHPTTLCAWRKQYPELVSKLEAAEVRGMESRLRTISNAAVDSPKWAAWILEHRWPEKWSRANRGQVSVHIDGPSQVAVVDQAVCQQISDSWSKFQDSHIPNS